MGQIMTEEVWQVCNSPYEMLKPLATQRPSSQRKWLLFGAATCRRVWHALVAELSHYCVELAEEYADGNATTTNWKGALRATRYPYPGTDPGALAIRCIDWVTAKALIDVVGQTVAQATGDFGPETWGREFRAQAALLRDIFGNPFRSSVMSPARLDSNVATVKLAREIYENGEFDRMASLGEALAKAGCDDRSLLDHCRQSEPHVRGCWVLDLILEKK